MVLRFDVIKNLFHEFLKEFFLIKGSILKLPEQVTHFRSVHHHDAGVSQNPFAGVFQSRNLLLDAAVIIFSCECFRLEIKDDSVHVRYP